MAKDRLLSVAAEIIRYGVVGVLNNLVGYFIYLLITWLWLDPIVAVTVLYPIGALTAYFGHARYSFSQAGHTSKGFRRYVVAQLIGYGTNLLMLYVFAEKLMFPHQIVQAVAIIVVAGILYLLLRYFVFPTNPTTSEF